MLPAELGCTTGHRAGETAAAAQPGGFTASAENRVGCVLLSATEFIENYLLVRDSDIQIEKMTLTGHRFLR